MRNIPFRAAIFDLDGTLLDSMSVWKEVDKVFFASRGLAVPEHYGQAVAGMSYRETAMYTVENYLPGERWQDVIDEWTRLTRIEYAQNVRLKPGARSYLRLLKRQGIPMAVATALPPNLYEPCLTHLGVIDLFDALCSTEHTGGRGKGSGEVFLLAAEKLGVKPSECAVFEDVLTGIQGAKSAGMLAYGVRDAHSRNQFDAMAALADGMVDTLSDMRRYHDWPSSRCVIFTARCEGSPEYAPQPGDLVLCADGGWKVASGMGVKPDWVIGDFDSAEEPSSGRVERHPVMKDDTDTMLCLKRGLSLGYERFVIVGGFGGRLDHTLANLQTLVYASRHGASAVMMDGHCRARVLENGTVRLKRRPGKLSLFSLSDRCRGVWARGVAYPLEDAELTNAFPLGVSNEFAGEEAEISIREGTLLILETEDDTIF